MDSRTLVGHGTRVMFFYASKIIWFFLTPSNLLTVLALVGVLIGFTRWRRPGLSAALLGLFGLLIAGLSPVGYWLILPLETRFERPDPMPETVTSIVLLGGFADTRDGRTLETADLNEAADRFVAVKALARRYPQARIVMSGGSGRLISRGFAEADYMEAALLDAGFDRSRLVREGQSRNTAENARYSHDLVQPQPGETHLLVTSAFHMPRSMGVFRAAGWTDIVPYPVDFRSVGPADRTRPFSSVSFGLRRVDMAVREWIGLIAYRLTGRTDQVLPSPSRGDASR